MLTTISKTEAEIAAAVGEAVVEDAGWNGVAAGGWWSEEMYKLRSAVVGAMGVGSMLGFVRGGPVRCMER